MTIQTSLGKSFRAGVGVGLCTYKRPAGLARVLEHLAVAAGQLGEPVHVIVVDNDGADAAIGEIVAQFERTSGLSATYVVETRPGISAARNAVFAEVDRLGLRFVAMIDDDEWPAPTWLTELLAKQTQSGAAIIGGPVRPVFPEGERALQKLTRYWSVVPQLLDGKPFVFCTCNFLVDMDRLDDVERPFFQDKFGLTGGGDTVFFRGLFYSGHDMAWAPNALVFEEVPASRASLRWMRTRRFRSGNHAVHWERVGRRPGQVLAKTVGLTARLPLYLLLNREPESRLVGWLLELEKVRGRYAAHLGSHFAEYARPTAPGAKACR